MTERLGVVGSGAIASGIAATAAAARTPVTLCARSEESAERARRRITVLCERFDPPLSPEGTITITTAPPALADATFIIEAIAEDIDSKTALLAALRSVIGTETILASTTSSLSIEALAASSGVAERFVGLHVFNPVTRMELVELVFPAAASDATRARARELCETLGKTAVEVPDMPGFVVNRLLFPFLFHAVEMLEQTGITPQELDDCLRLGAGHPMGPLALLDLVGIDVSIAIGERIGATIPPSLYTLAHAGTLGRKSGQGFHHYDERTAKR